MSNPTGDALANLEFRIRPRVQVRLPQCDAVFDNGVFAEHYVKRRSKAVEAKGWDVNRCNRAANYRLGSKCYCSVHTANRLLALVEQGKIKLPEDLP